jgi:hypothetical protein
MRHASRWASLLAALAATACGASSSSTSTTVGEPTTVVLPTVAATTPTLETPAALPPRADLEWTVFGDTPTVAWAPDGVRLAIANQVNYLNTPADPNDAGIDVVDVQTGKRTRVHEGPGYHPVWLSDDAMAFGCSPYECDKGEGLYLLRLGSRAKLALSRGVYHTRAGRDGGVIFFSGFPEYDGWMSVDPSAPRPRKLGIDKDSWKAPPHALADQCPSKVGGRRVEASGGKVILHDDDAGRTQELAAATPWRLTWPETGGVIQPCLSPDGRFVVYFSQRLGSGFVGVKSLGPL